MSELNSNHPKQALEGKKPQKASLTELLRVDVDGGPTLLSSRRNEREVELAAARTADAQAAAPEATTPAPEIDPAPTEGVSEESSENPGAARPTTGAMTNVAPRIAREERVVVSKPKVGWQIAGLCLASAGLLLIPAHHLSASIARIL